VTWCRRAGWACSAGFHRRCRVRAVAWSGVQLERPEPWGAREGAGEDERAGRWRAAADDRERGRAFAGYGVAGVRGRWAWRPGVRGWSEWSHMHPSGICRVAGAMTVISGGPGLLSQVIECGWAGSCGFASSPGGLATPPGRYLSCGGCWSGVLEACGAVGHPFRQARRYPRRRVRRVGRRRSRRLARTAPCRPLARDPNMAVRTPIPLRGHMRRSRTRTQSCGAQPRETVVRHAGIIPSVGHIGICYGNAAAESFNATIKKELIYQPVWRDAGEVRTAVFD